MKFIVYWSNDCGYGTEYFATEEEQKAFIKDCRRFGTEAYPGERQ